MLRAALAGFIGLLLVALPSTGRAKPQWSAAAETGLCSSGPDLGLSNPSWCNALHADVLLLRERGSDFGLGPSLRLGTAGFDDFRIDAGLSLLVPVFESFPLVFEVGPHLRNLNQPGIFASAFFGLRSLNHYGHYEMNGGLLLLAERSFSTGTPSALWLVARVDAAWIALPFVFAFNALR